MREEDSLLRFLFGVRGSMSWVAIVFLSTGCSQYVAVSGTGVSPRRGASVRAHLRVPEEYPAGDIIVPNVATIAGEMVERNNDEVLVSSLWVRSIGGLEHRGIGETISIPLGNLQALEVKRVAPLQTAVFVGLVGLVAALLPLALSGGGGQPLPGNGGGTHEQ